MITDAEIPQHAKCLECGCRYAALCAELEAAKDRIEQLANELMIEHYRPVASCWRVNEDLD